MKILNNDSLIKICDYELENTLPDKNCIIHSSLTRINDILNQAKEKKYKYIIICNNDDFCLSYNYKDLLNDILKNALIIQRQKTFLETGELPWNGKYIYEQFVKENINASKRYVVHTDQWIDSTFNPEDIPDNVIFFTTHLNIYHKQFYIIPFGANQQIKNIEHKNNINKIYCKFSNNAAQRVLIKKNCKNNSDYYFNEEFYNDVNLTFEEMSNYKYCLCPKGNGYDNYRTIEAVFLGCQLIMQKTIFSELMSYHFPIHQVDNILDVKIEKLQKIPFSKQGVYEDYWIKYVYDICRTNNLSI